MVVLARPGAVGLAWVWRTQDDRSLPVALTADEDRAMSNQLDLRTDGTRQRILARADRPLLITDATIHTGDERCGSHRKADLLVAFGVVVGVGPGIIHAADDDDAVVVVATEATIIPAALPVATASETDRRCPAAGSLAPGQGADFLVVDGDHATLGTAVAAAQSPHGVLADFRAGELRAWGGQGVARGREATREVVGPWLDSTGFLLQELGADGRYDETRGGRKHAFTGRYWVEGDWIDYLDDLGFWAFGTFDGEVLHHAGYAMRRLDEGTERTAATA